jgi:glycosyltransferase involved in cell wall biosynthesis
MKLAIVVPCYNEEEVLTETATRLIHLLDKLIAQEKVARTSKIYFVDDGSRDNTWKIIEKLSGENEHIGGIKLSRNRGHQNALLAGLFTAEGDAVVSIDADLQDDIRVIEEMVRDCGNGVDIVYGVRKKRETDAPFKRITAQMFYKFMRLMRVEVLGDHADYRLMSRKAIQALREFKEVNLFLRGIVPLIGFKSSIVYYERAERFAGASKYPLMKMLAFAVEGITSFSVIPLRVITMLGVFTFMGTMLMSAWTVAVKLFTHHVVPGWTSTVLPMYLLGGIQILCIGIIGEYLGKTYSETKARPRYIIEKMV